MMKNLLLSLPTEIQIHISEYNVEHRQKFYWALKDIQEPSYCQTCDKLIKKCIWSNRNGDEVCCSEGCLDDLYFVTNLPNGRRALWIGDEIINIPSRADYEYTNY
jgi:hypothetical protein